jgi:hypothetical protein
MLQGGGRWVKGIRASALDGRTRPSFVPEKNPVATILGNGSYVLNRASVRLRISP